MNEKKLLVSQVHAPLITVRRGIANMYRWAKKVGPQTHDHNSVKYLLIKKLFHWKNPW